MVAVELFEDTFVFLIRNSIPQVSDFDDRLVFQTLDGNFDITGT